MGALAPPHLQFDYNNDRGLSLELIVLGAAAGGGLPQWNCAGGQSKTVWFKSRPAQTQASVAVGSAKNGYVVINASPDLRHQILATRQLHPTEEVGRSVRNTPIKAVIVTNADVDNIAGLLNLREKQKFKLFGPEKVLEVINKNSIFSVLDPVCVKKHPLETGQVVSPIPDLQIELFHVPGKAPLYLERSLGIESGNFGFTSGVEVRTKQSTTLIISSCAYLDDPLKERIARATNLLFDGTVFENNEMEEQGLGKKTGSRMGHLPISGTNGPLEQLAPYQLNRKIFFHINNSNPIWDHSSEAFATIQKAGWETSYDSMVLPL